MNCFIVKIRFISVDIFFQTKMNDVCQKCDLSKENVFNLFAFKYHNINDFLFNTT